MSLISFTPLADGVTAVNAAATNTPLSTIYNDYNGNITDANITSGAAIATSKLALNTAWQTWSPSYANLTVGNGTVTARYYQVAKMVFCYWQLVAGSTTTIGTSPTISLPVTSLSQALTRNPIGTAQFFDASAAYANAWGYSRLDTTTTMQPIALTVSGSFLASSGITASSPITWATSDEIVLRWSYEAA